ncbi:MAG: hypothetical protein JSU89_09590 [Myxococcales bacterium]|nr:MAG: hypothetical protein JSU89_09590 [Myxococcales bacterium]
MSSIKDLTPRPTWALEERMPTQDTQLIHLPGVSIRIPGKVLAESGPSGVQVDWDQVHTSLYALLASFHIGDSPQTLAEIYNTTPLLED